jgi:hypothetical protein
MMNLWISVRRTVAPVVVGALMASRVGHLLDPVLTAEAVVAVLAAGYYLVVRLLEQVGAPGASLLLGGGMPPHYEMDTDLLP